MAYIPSGCTVKEYEEVVYSGKCDNKLYLSFGGVELENADEYCEKITGTNKILSNGNNYFSLDNFVSRELNITLHDIEIKKIIDPVNVKIGTNVNGTYIYVPIGIFNIQDSPKSAKGTIKIQLRDNSVKFDFKYNAKPLIDLNGGSATKRQILEDICTKAGVKHKIPYFLGEDDEIGIYDSTVKARVYVSYIAEQGGVFPTIDRDGDLIFVDIKDQKKVVTGKTINLLNATNRELAKLTFDGRSTQEGTPTPDNPIEIKSIEGIVQYKQVGDNIFNKNNVSFTLKAKKDVLDTGVRVTVSVAGNYRYVAIKLGGSELLGKKITIQTKITPSANNEGQLSLFYGTSTSLNSKYRIVDVNTTNPTNAYILNTFPDNFDTIWCCFYGNLTGIGNVGDYVDYTDMMIVMGDSIADGYKPYQETILNINLQGNKLCSLSNGVKDELVVENGRAKIIKNVQEDLLDGVNKKFTRIDLRGDKTFLICNYANTNIKIATSENEVIPLSNKFRSTSIYNTWNGVVIYGISQSNNGHYLQFSFPKTISADLTLDGLNAWLVNNNTKFQYQLETPQIIDLGEVTQPKTFEGVNNISNSEDTNMSVEYLSPKEPKKLPIDYIEDYEDGEPYEISKTIYESGIIKFEDGTETNDILYLNSANPYISNLEQVKKINENLKGLKLNSFSISKIKGNLLIDPYDLIEVESENGKFVTLGQNTFTYDGSIMQSFSTKIGKEIRKTNVSANSEATYRKLAQTEIDNVKGEIRLYVEEQVGQVEDQINGESGINENLELIKNSIETIKSTMLKQTAEQFEMLFKQTGIEEIVNSVDNLTKDNNTKLNELEQWIRFKGASIELGRSDSQVKLMLQNDEIYFMTGGVKTGRIKDNMIFIENSIVTNSFKQGLSASGQDKALWEERVETSGNKNLRWIGGAY